MQTNTGSVYWDNKLEPRWSYLSTMKAITESWWRVHCVCSHQVHLVVNAAGSHGSTLLCLCFMLALPTTCVWFEPDELMSSPLICICWVVMFMVCCDWMFLLKLWRRLCTLNALAGNGGDSGQNKVMLLMIHCCLSHINSCISTNEVFSLDSCIQVVYSLTFTVHCQKQPREIGKCSWRTCMKPSSSGETRLKHCSLFIL